LLEYLTISTKNAINALLMTILVQRAAERQNCLSARQCTSESCVQHSQTAAVEKLSAFFFLTYRPETVQSVKSLAIQQATRLNKLSQRLV